MVMTVHFCVHGLFTAEKVDGLGDRGQGNTTLVDVQTLLEAFLDVSLRYACYVNEAFS